MSKVEEAVERFMGDQNCSQSILATFGPDLGLDEETAIKLAGPFGGGISRTGQTCGAVTGAMMVIGLRFGSTDPGDKVAKEELLRISRSFIQRYIDVNGELRCSDLLGIDIGTPEGRAEAKRKDLFNTTCPDLVRSSSRILDEMLSD